jgi:hypothetical protein
VFQVIIAFLGGFGWRLEDFGLTPKKLRLFVPQVVVKLLKLGVVNFLSGLLPRTIIRR